MTSRDFCYWLQGWFELNQTIDHREGATPATLKMIKNHLALVFKHEIDPSIPDPTGELQEIRDHGYDGDGSGHYGVPAAGNDSPFYNQPQDITCGVGPFKPNDLTDLPDLKKPKPDGHTIRC